MRSGFVAAGLCASVLLSCGGREPVEEPPEDVRVRGDATVGGDVVSTVNGHAITHAQVEAAARAAAVPAPLALRRLQDELILARAAAAHSRPAPEAELRRAVVQAAVQRVLFDEVEERVGAAQVDEAALARRFEAELARFEQPERRASTHLVALLPEDASPALVEAAREYVAEQRAAAAASPDPASALLAVTRRLDGVAAFEVRAEEVPGLTRRDAADPAYLSALYDGSPGLLPELVRTQYGWHAIVLTEIEPAVEVSREEALATLRAEEIARLRAARLEVLITELAQVHGVAVDQAGVRAALTDPRLLGDSP